MAHVCACLLPKPQSQICISPILTAVCNRIPEWKSNKALADLHLQVPSHHKIGWPLLGKLLPISTKLIVIVTINKTDSNLM